MFENILGNEKAKKCLMDDIKNDTTSHAYIFSGMEGVGKTSLAIEFAKQLLKTDNIISCPDFKVVEPNEGKTEIATHDIRHELVDKAYIAPAASNKKVFVIKQAEKLNKNSANALLKILEEPPEYICIILVTNQINTIIPTILSRVKKIEFVGIEDELIKKYFNNIGENITEGIIDYSSGSITKASQILDTEKNAELKETIEAIVSSIENRDTVSFLIKFADIDLKDEKLLEYFTYKLYEKKVYKALILIDELRQGLINSVNQDMLKTEFAIKAI